MDKNLNIPSSKDIHLDEDYSKWLIDLIGRYRNAQIKAAVKVNVEKLLWNWLMGRDLVLRKAESRWGTGIVEQLSFDLQAAFPEEKGFSTSNIWYMKKWYLFYSGKINQVLRESINIPNQILHHFGGEMQSSAIQLNIGHQSMDIKENNPIEEVTLPSIMAFVPWRHHIEIITKCKTIEEAIFYLKLTVQESLSRQALMNCLKANLFKTQAGAVTNFNERLPNPHSQLAQEMTKENYDFGFLTLPKDFSEKKLEDALCNQMTQFLLELGSGFAFIGRQKEIIVSGISRKIDLLFYHIRLHSYIVLEIKAKPFEPEFAGKINFYVNAVDQILKTAEDNPTIGLLICSDMKKTEVQLSFQGITTPLSVATYNNIQIEEIKKQLPTYEQLVERVRNLELQLTTRVSNIL